MNVHPSALWGKHVAPLLQNGEHCHRDDPVVMVWSFYRVLNCEQALLLRGEIHLWGFRLTSSYIFLFLSFTKDIKHPRKCVVIHQNKYTLEYVEWKPKNFTRSTTEWNEKSRRKPVMKPEIFLYVQLFFFLTLALFLGSIFCSLIFPDLMLTCVKTNLSRFFLLTEDCFNVNFKAVVLNLALCFRQTDFPLPTTQSADLPICFGLLEVFCDVIWRYHMNCSAYIRWGTLQNEWPSVSFLCQFTSQDKLTVACWFCI